MISKGDKGFAVKKIQEALLAKGYDLGSWGADGDYGSVTKAAVRKFQQDTDLSDTGAVGGVTLHFLLPGKVGPKGPKGNDGATPNLSNYRLTRSS